MLLFTSSSVKPLLQTAPESLPRCPTTIPIFRAGKPRGSSTGSELVSGASAWLGLAACATLFCKLPGIRLPGIQSENKVAVMTPTPMTEVSTCTKSLSILKPERLREASSMTASRLEERL